MTSSQYDSKVELVDIRTDVGSDWIHFSLEGGWELSKRVLGEFDFASGLTVATLPSNLATVPPLKWGMRMSSLAAKSALNDFLKVVESPSCLLVENELASKRDPATARRNYNQAFLGERIYHWGDLDGRDNESVFEALKMGSAGFPTNAFLIRSDASELGLRHNAEVPDDFLDTCVNQLEAVVVAAFDAEGFLIWSGGSALQSLAAPLKHG